MFSMPTVFEEIKHVVLVKYEFEYRENANSFFSEFSDSQDTDAREKNHEFLVENSSTSAVFSIQILMKVIELLVAEN